MERPVAEQIPHSVPFGVVEKEERGDLSKLITPAFLREDKYFWMRDDSRKSEKVIQHLKNENEYTEKLMQDTESLRTKLYQEHLSHLQENRDTVALPHGDKGWDSDYYYFTRKVEGKSFNIHCRYNRKDLNNITEEILLDENALKEEILSKAENGSDSTNFDLSSFSVSKNHKTMTYGIDLLGNEEYELYIVDIETKQEKPHKLPKILYCQYLWFDKDLYYVQADAANRPYQVYRYDMQTQEQTLIYQSDNELTFVGIYDSNDGNYLFIKASTYEYSDILFMKKGDEKVTRLVEPKENFKFSISFHNDRFVIRTNLDGATNFKLMSCLPEECSDTSKWTEILPYEEDTFLSGIYTLKNYLILTTTRKGNDYIKVLPYNHEISNYQTSQAHEIEIEDAIKSVSINGYDCYDVDHIVYTRTSLSTPYTTYKYNLNTKEAEFLDQYPVPKYDKELYQTERIYAPSHDGVEVPISLIYRKDKFGQDGSNPLYLYGYGSYGYNVDPIFMASILPLIDRGFVYAIAHIRGSRFLGENWYENGKMKTKMNTFLDFIACGQHLINEKYTFDQGITIEGRSAGGLLVGAAMTLKPDLFRTVVAGVPFVDVLNTMSDPSIPLTTQEWKQWGNPNIQEDYDYIAKYCPYTNIRDNENYPHLLALGGLHDPRVAYWEPAKFVAKLREHYSGDSMILLKTEMDSGHFGMKDRYKYYKEKSYQQAFVLKTYGIYD